MAKYLQAAGYHTGMIGKWHLGSDRTGFDKWIVLPGQGVYFNPAFFVPEGRTAIQGYVTDVIKPGSVQDALAINPDFAPTFMEAAGLPVPEDMQGRSLVPLMKGDHSADWRSSVYCRYYHHPGNHNTRAHYGVRTDTHKLICYWKKDQWELFDLRDDPDELRNIYNDPAQQPIVARLKTELYRFEKELRKR